MRMMRTFGLADVKDEALEELSHPRPAYDVDRLDTKALVNLAEAMYWAARESLH
jgi:hypothetical protein